MIRVQIILDYIINYMTNNMCFIGSLGYDINNVPLIQNLYGKQPEAPTLPKKKKECNLGNDSVSI